MVAADTKGSVYVAEGRHSPSPQVLKLLPGATAPIQMPFNDITSPVGVAVDGDGNVYVADSFNGGVQKLPVGANAATKLPFTVPGPSSVAVDADGNVYATDPMTKRVLKLPPGSSHQVELPFAGPRGLKSTVAVDTQGNVYVADSIFGLVQKFSPGST